MATSADLEFYSHRERQERSLAARAPNAEGRRIHLELANRYARMIEEGQPGDRPTLHPPMPG